VRLIDKHIIHCSDTPNNRDVTPEEIRDWHVNGNGWDDIGYHFVITRDGILHEGRPLEKVGAHCYGQNTNSVGTCLVGRDKFTKKQTETLITLQKLLKALIPTMKVTQGHCDYDPRKTCPNFSVQEFLKKNRL